MDLIDNNLHISDFTGADSSNFNCIQQFLSENFNPEYLSGNYIDFDTNNSWVWSSSLNDNNILLVVYNHFNSLNSANYFWIGWKNFLKVMLLLGLSFLLGCYFMAVLKLLIFSMI